MPRTTLTAIDLCKMMPSVFNRESALYITDSTRHANREAYTEYRKFFDANPDRRLHLCQSHLGEFDQFTDPLQFAQLPYSYVLVAVLCPEVYEVSLRYFGRKYHQQITDAKTDTDVALLLMRMQADRGQNKQETDAFLEQVRMNSDGKLAELQALEDANASQLVN